MSDEAKLMHEKVRAAQERTIRSLESQNQALQEALDLIATIQPGVLSMLRREGFKFETPLTESEGWEKLAFTLYLTICEVDSIARNALSPTQETDHRCPTCGGRWVGDPEGSGKPCLDPFHARPTQETDPFGDLGADLRARYGAQETDPE